MASKRLSMIDYAEDHTSSDEDDDMLVDSHDMDDFIAQQDSSRSAGRSRKPSLSNTNSSDTIAAAPTRRRGRGPSKRPCLNRNALMARENRQRKKEYIERIEAKLQNFQSENQELTSTIQKQNVEIKRLGNEVNYLKAVLKNQTTITALLTAMNESLGRMNGDGAGAAAQQGNNGIAKASPDVINWIVSGQTNSSKTNNLSMPFSGTTATTTTNNNNSSEAFKSDNRRQNYGQPISKIARKTMPFTMQNSHLLKSEDPSSVESLFDDDEQKNVQISSPQSGSFCEYIVDKSPVVPDNQQPMTPMTPMSVLSNSLDKADELSQLNVDFLGLEDAVPLQFEQGDLFGNETLFQSDDVLTSDLNDPLLIKDIPPLSMNEIFDGINQKDNFTLDGLDNAGVCLHINSTRVSLEYCSICHNNSLNSEILQN